MRASTASIRDILQRTYAASHEPTLGGISMLKRSLTALFIPALACATVIAQELSPTHLHQPTLTPQNSGTTNGLIAVWPVNPQVIWACDRAGTFTFTTDGGKTWTACGEPVEGVVES